MAKKAKPLFLTGASDFARYMEREMDAASWMRHGRWEVWRSWVSWLLAGYQEDPERTAELEARLPEAVEAWKAWRVALEAAAKANPYGDALGTSYMAIGHGNKAMAQYFTAPSLASMMARMLVGEEPFTPEGRFLLGCEPTCGSGVMILATAEFRESNGLPPVVFQAMDLDGHCAEMAAVQCYLADAPALILCCDSLKFGLVPGAEATVVSPRVHTQQGDEPPKRLERVDAAGAQMLLEKVREGAEQAWARRELARWLAPAQATGAETVPEPLQAPQPPEQLRVEPEGRRKRRSA